MAVAKCVRIQFLPLPDQTLCPRRDSKDGGGSKEKSVDGKYIDHRVQNKKCKVIV